MPFQAKVNEPFWAVFNISNAVNMYGADGYLQYDPAAIEIVVEDGAFVSEIYGFLGQIGQIKFRLALLDGRPGVLLFTINRGEIKTGVAGNGSLWRTKITALRSGTHALTFIEGKCNVVSPKLVIVGGVTQAERLPSEFVGAAFEATDETNMARARVTITFEAI